MWIVLPGTFRHQHRYGWIDWRSQTINWINQKPSLISIFHDRLLKNCMTNFNSIATKCPMTRTIKIWKAHMPNMKIILTNSVSNIYFKSCDEFCAQKWWTWWIVPIQTELNFDLTFDTNTKLNAQFKYTKQIENHSSNLFFKYFSVKLCLFFILSCYINLEENRKLNWF